MVSPLYFNGSHPHILDEKGRLILPSCFREELKKSDFPDKLYISFYPHSRYLSLYPVEAWRKLAAMWEEEDRFPSKAIMQAGQRVFFANSEEAGIDRVGRILIPAVLRNNARLQRDIVVIGNNDKMELWAAEVMAEKLESDFGILEKYAKEESSRDESGRLTGRLLPLW